MGVDDLEQVLVTSRAEWRAWLEGNAGSSRGVWLVTYRRSSGRPAPSYDDVVEEALCFGWIDSTVRTRDAETAMQLLTPRKPRSTWSASNKARMERLLTSGLMTDRGLRAIEVAKANGWWDILDPVERLEVPDDLARALEAAPPAQEKFDTFSPSTRKMLIWHVVSAQRAATRAARIERIVSEAALGRSAVG